MSDLEWTFTTIALVILVIGFLISSFKIIPEYERGVVSGSANWAGCTVPGSCLSSPASTSCTESTNAP